VHESEPHAAKLEQLVWQLQQSVATNRAAFEVTVQLRLCGVLAAELSRLARACLLSVNERCIGGLSWATGQLLDGCCALTDCTSSSRVLHAVCLRGLVGNATLWSNAPPLVGCAWTRRVSDLADRDVDALRKLLGWDCQDICDAATATIPSIAVPASAVVDHTRESMVSQPPDMFAGESASLEWERMIAAAVDFSAQFASKELDI